MLTLKTRLNKYFTYATLLFMILLNSSCSKDEDLGGRDQFLGDYSVVDNRTNIRNGVSTPYLANYDTSISIDNSGIMNVQILNFYDLQDDFGAPASDVIIASIEGNIITIASQSLFGITFEGRGTRSGGIITITYETQGENPTDTSNGTAVYTPK